ncbi:hypothetical protein [Pseudoalteromonas sp. S2893]|uniref:hypothetical protein n=1 Tax=Pseudoalteromonas sp. S2893 TaxID=579530 RepID=UPI0020162547|nr:hypothetical protein [Pseudoalteromonas sp. S2893]
MLLLKLTIAPLLLLFIHFAQKRFGSFVSGIIPGLPITSGPISYFIALEQSKLFASNSAVASLYGMSGIGLFCFCYAAMLAKYGVVKALFAALTLWCAFSAFTLLLPVNIAFASVLSLSTLLVLALASSKLKFAPDAKPFTAAWELPLKMLLVSCFIMLVTFISAKIGAMWSGLLSTFPVILAVMGSIAHASDKKYSAYKVLNGGIIGSLGGCVFFAVIALALKFEFVIWQVYAAAAVCSTLFTIIMSHYVNRKQFAKPATV